MTVVAQPFVPEGRTVASGRGGHAPTYSLDFVALYYPNLYGRILFVVPLELAAQVHSLQRGGHPFVLF